jgi:hypothetical protein
MLKWLTVQKLNKEGVLRDHNLLCNTTYLGIQTVFCSLIANTVYINISIQNYYPCALDIIIVSTYTS